MALGLSISAVLLHQRRNAALNTSNLLLSHNKDSLRAAPLNSSSLFGSKIEEVFRANLDDRHHSLLRANYSGVSANRKRPSSSTFNSNPAKKSRWEPKASRVPTSTSSSSAFSFKRFRSTKGGRGGSSSFRGGPLGGVNDIIRALPSAPHPSLPVGARLLNFCGGLVSHNSGFLGPLYSPEGLQDSFCKGTSIIVVSNSVPRSSTTFKSLEGGGADSTGKEGCRDCERYHLSRFLQPDFS